MKVATHCADSPCSINRTLWISVAGLGFMWLSTVFNVSWKLSTWQADITMVCNVYVMVWCPMWYLLQFCKNYELKIVCWFALLFFLSFLSLQQRFTLSYTFPVPSHPFFPAAETDCGESSSMHPRNASIHHIPTHTHSQPPGALPALRGHCIWHVGALSLALSLALCLSLSLSLPVSAQSTMDIFCVNQIVML